MPNLEAILLVPVFAAGAGALIGANVGYAGIVSSLFNFGAMGILSAVLFYIYHQQRKDHKEQMEILRADHKADMKEAREEMTNMIASVLSNFKDRDLDRQKNINYLATETREFREEMRVAFHAVSEAINEMRYAKLVRTDERFRDATVRHNEALQQETKPKGRADKGGG